MNIQLVLPAAAGVCLGILGAGHGLAHRAMLAPNERTRTSLILPVVAITLALVCAALLTWEATR